MTVTLILDEFELMQLLDDFPHAIDYFILDHARIIESAWSERDIAPYAPSDQDGPPWVADEDDPYRGGYEPTEDTFAASVAIRLIRNHNIEGQAAREAVTDNRADVGRHWHTGAHPDEAATWLAARLT